MVGDGGAAGDGRGNAVPKKSIGVYYILRIAVCPRLIFIGASRTLRPTRVAEKLYSNLRYLTGGRRKSFVCDDSRNIVYAKHNIICRKATSFSERKRK